MDIKLSTPVQENNPPRLFDYSSVIVGIGSCFAQYVMEEFLRLGFQTAFNPNGIVYNSYSIAQSLNFLEKDYPDDTLFEYNGFWHSWEHHGSFSSKTKSDLMDKINQAKKSFLDQVKKAELFVLTPSSSVVYLHKDSGKITANCHKVPNKNFSVEILSKEDNLRNLQKSISIIRSYNPNCLITITLSPVRHYPGNLCLNSRSKANLLAAICECVEQTENCIYFPSYEILLDELRDYRFYSEDMMHPSHIARKIIFERFIDSYFDRKTLDTVREKEKKLKFLSHRKI